MDKPTNKPKTNPYLDVHETPKEKLIRLVAECQDEKLVRELIAQFESFLQEPPAKYSTGLKFSDLPDRVQEGIERGLKDVEEGRVYSLDQVESYVDQNLAE